MFIRLRLWLANHILGLDLRMPLECDICKFKRMCFESDGVDRVLIGEFSAQQWAEGFVKMARENPRMATSESTMLAWFANSIMAGYDHAKNGG